MKSWQKSPPAYDQINIFHSYKIFLAANTISLAMTLIKIEKSGITLKNNH